MTLDKLPGIRKDAVRQDEDWQEWNFPQLYGTSRKWTTRSPKVILRPGEGFRREMD